MELKMQKSEMAENGESSTPPVWTIVVSFAILLGFLSLIGWGLLRTRQGPISIGQGSPDFQLTTFEGQQYQKTQLSGKIVVINFWASWCSECEGEAVLMENAWQRLSSEEDIVFLGVDYVDTENEAKRFLQSNQITYPNGPDTGTEIADAFRIAGVPETFIIDRNGNIAYIQIGPFFSADELIQIIENIQ